MRAYVLTEQGPVLRDGVAVPAPGPTDVLVAVQACALNYADLAIAAGRPHGSVGGVGTVLGLEWAGEVVQAGAAVEGIGVGDRVMCAGSGAFAEYACADAGRTVRIPDGMDVVQGACLPIACATMHDALITNGGLVAGESVLIHGASSGVGLMGLQVAALTGASVVIGTSRSEQRCHRLAEFGASVAVDTSDPAWPDRILEATHGDGVDLVVDQVSGEQVNDLLRVCRIGGRIVNVGRLGGRQGRFDFDLHALRRITYRGVTFRTRTSEESAEVTRRAMADLGAALAAGRLTLPIDRVFGFDAVLDALEHMRAGRHFGKIVIAPV